jgi:hypothetical protein
MVFLLVIRDDADAVRAGSAYYPRKFGRRQEEFARERKSSTLDSKLVPRPD